MVYLSHGMSSTSTYRIWQAMFQRCTNPNHESYHLYGGRGIKVCKRWHRFENFLADMGERPAGMSIERENNSKGYGPRNCRWATPREQSLNRRDTRNLTFQGETMCLTDWAARVGLSPQRLRGRLKAGWELDKALTIPAGAGPIGRPKRQVT